MIVAWVLIVRRACVPASDDSPRVPQPREGGEQRHGHSPDEDVGAGMPQLTRPVVVFATNRRDDVKDGGERVGSDGEVSERWMQGFAGPPAQTLELAPLQRQRRPDREPSHANSLIEGILIARVRVPW
jgi:hypothetical protein